MTQAEKYAMIGETTSAHATFSPPAIFMTILIEEPGGKTFCICPTGVPNFLPLYPCSCQATCELTAETLMAMFRLPRVLLSTSRIALISDQSLFKDAYVYLFVVSIDGDSLKEWRPPTDLHVVPLADCQPCAPLTARLLAHIAIQPVRDNLAFTPLPNAAEARDSRRDAATRIVKMQNLCMPLLTVNGIIFHVDRDGEPAGIILERRHHSLRREGGKWCVPAGFVNANESAAQALARETFEELGLSLRSGDITKMLFVLDPSPVEKVWINWPLFYQATTILRPEEFWEGPNDEVEAVAVFEIGRLPNPDEIAFGHGNLVWECAERVLNPDASIR